MRKTILNSMEAADEMGVTDARIRQMCIDGTLEGASKFSPRAWMIPLSSLRLLKKQRAREAREKERSKKNGGATS